MTDAKKIPQNFIFDADYADLVRKIDVIQLSLSSVNRQMHVPQMPTLNQHLYLSENRGFQMVQVSVLTDDSSSYLDAELVHCEFASKP